MSSPPHSRSPSPSPGKRLKTTISTEERNREIDLRKMFEAELSKLRDENLKQKAIISKQKAIISKQNAEKEAKSLWSVLPGSNVPIPNLIPRDMPTTSKRGQTRP
jgi:hypothetical protein